MTPRKNTKIIKIKFSSCNSSEGEMEIGVAVKMVAEDRQLMLKLWLRILMMLQQRTVALW